MTEWWWPILFVVAGVLGAQKLIVGYTKGVIEIRSTVVKRDEQPALFWFSVAIEAFIVVALAAMTIDWMLGGPLFGMGFQ